MFQIFLESLTVGFGVSFGLFLFLCLLILAIRFYDFLSFLLVEGFRWLVRCGGISAQFFHAKRFDK